MECDKYTSQIDFLNGGGKFFSNTNKNYEDILKTIRKDITDVDLDRLDGVCDEYKLLLESYADKMDISDNRINKLVDGLTERIEMLKDRIGK